MEKHIKELIDEIRSNATGKTCLGMGNYALDLFIQREYPEGFTVGKRNKFEEKLMGAEVGNTCANVMTMLPYLGMTTFPWAHFDDSQLGYRITRSLKRFGADVRFVRNDRKGGTTIMRCVYGRHKDTGIEQAISHRRSAVGGSSIQGNPAYKFISTKDDAVSKFIDKLDFTPDVFYFDEMKAGHREVAAQLREKGTLVYFECDNNGAQNLDEKKRRSNMKLFASCIRQSDVVKVSGANIPDVSFADDFEDKLFIQTMAEDGLRFKLGRGEWIKLNPVINPQYKDYEGAGDWTSSTFIAVISGMGMLSFNDMTEEKVRLALEKAQQIASYSVGFVTSKGMILADSEWTMKDDTLSIPPVAYSKKVLYLHGSATAGLESLAVALRKLLPDDWAFIAPDCPVDAEECLSMLKELCDSEKPDVIVGVSQGGYYAQMLRGYKRLLVHPAFEMSKDVDVKLGKHEFIFNRQDLVQKYFITPELQEGYRRLEALQFEGITDFDREYCYALFGDKDTDWGYCKDIFAQYYPHAIIHNSGHSISKDTLNNDILPLVMKLACNSEQ